MQATVVTLTFAMQGSLESFTTAQRAGLEQQIRAALSCFNPDCALVLVLSAGSIAVKATATVPTTSSNTVASVTMAAESMQAQTPSALSSLLGVTVETTVSVAVARDVQVQMVVPLPPPPRPPSSPTPPYMPTTSPLGTASAQTGVAAPASNTTALIVGLSLGIAAAVLLIGVLVRWKLRARAKERDLTLSQMEAPSPPQRFGTVEEMSSFIYGDNRPPPARGDLLTFIQKAAEESMKTKATTSGGGASGAGSADGETCSPLGSGAVPSDGNFGPGTQSSSVPDDSGEDTDDNDGADAATEGSAGRPTAVINDEFRLRI